MDKELIALLTKAVADITAALVLAGKQNLVERWTAPYVAAINSADARASCKDRNHG